MKKSNSIQQPITITLFIIYFLLLIWIILFKLQLSIAGLPNLRNINLIPFAESVIINGRLAIQELIYNLILFIPLGIYLRVLKPERSLPLTLLLSFAISLAFETLQFIFAIGATDITDLITNTSGAAIGLMVYALLRKLCKDSRKTQKVINVLAAVATLLFLLLLILILTTVRLQFNN